MQFKLGKLAPREAPLKLRTYAVALAAPPAQANLDALHLADSNVFANDRLGDCAIAGPAHETLFWESHNGRPDAPITDQDVIAMYSDVTGYNPADPSSDQGSCVADVVHYRRTHGLIDSAGTAHKIAVGLGVAHNATEVRQSISLFDVCGLGIQVPQQMMDAVQAGSDIWDLPQGEPDIVGGHYIAAIAYDPQFIHVISWGRLFRMTWRFWEALADEQWAYLSPEDVNGSGISPNGLNLEQLQADIAQL
jgi:hypothetical protein